MLLQAALDATEDRNQTLSLEVAGLTQRLAAAEERRYPHPYYV